jgi:hypothetical protein
MCDPIGQAIHDYFEYGEAENLVIETNYTEDELLSSSYFFRTIDEMPSIERTALKLCSGKILDIGAAAGCHALPLQKQGFEVTALEKSMPAVEVMKKRGVENVICTNVYQFHKKRFDTILVLMNGTGIGGTLAGLKDLLIHLKSLMTIDGKILIDSSDISYLFQETDGSVWIDLANDNYHGEMDYTVIYKDLKSSFKWLFTDFDTLESVAGTAGLKCRLIEEGPHFEYLAQLTR